jgi:hypothetical protein
MRALLIRYHAYMLQNHENTITSACNIVIKVPTAMRPLARSLSSSLTATYPINPPMISNNNATKYHALDGFGNICSGARASLTFYFTDGSAKSNEVISTYHEILPLPHTEHKRTKS